MTFVGRTRVTPGTPAPGQEAEAARHAGREVDGLAYEAFEPMALRVLERDRRRDRGAVRRAPGRDRPPHRARCPLGEASVVVVAVAPHRDAAFAGGPLRDRRDQGARADLEGRAVRRRPRLDRRGRRARAPTPPERRGADRRAVRPTRTDRYRRVPHSSPFRAIGRPPYCGHAADREPEQLEALLRSRNHARRRLGRRGRRGARPSGRSAPSCACSASRASTAPGTRSPPRSSTASSRPIRAGSAAASRSRSRWRWPSTTCAPQELALEVAAGNVDLGLEAELLAESDRRAVAVANAELARARRAGPDRREPDRPPRAARPARRPAAAVARASPSGRPRSSTRWTRRGSRSRPARSSSGSTSRRAASWPTASARLRGAGRGRGGRPTRRAAASTRSTRPARRSPPAPSARSSVLRRFVDEAGARRRGYVRLATDAPALAAPDQAVVAAFERIDLVVADPMREIVAGPRGPGSRARRSRVRASPARACRARACSCPPGRCSWRRTWPPGSRPVPRPARAGPSRCSCSRSPWRAATGSRPMRWSSGRCPTGSSDEPDFAARAAAEIALRRALLPGHPLAFVEPAMGDELRARWQRRRERAPARCRRRRGDPPPVRRRDRADRDDAGWPQVAASLRGVAHPAGAHRGRGRPRERRGCGGDPDPRRARGSRLAGARRPAARLVGTPAASRPSPSGPSAFDPLAIEVAARPSRSSRRVSSSGSSSATSPAQVGQCQRGLERRPAQRRGGAAPAMPPRRDAPVGEQVERAGELAPVGGQRVLHPHRAPACTASRRGSRPARGGGAGRRGCSARSRARPRPAR